jgi:ribokinase
MAVMGDHPATTRVLVVGDANPDLVLRGDVVPRFGQVEQLLDAADLVIGGSAAIAAHALARLGRPVSLVAAVGTDAFGGLQCELLGAAGVDTGPLVARTTLPTGLTVVLSRGDDRAILTFPGAIPTLTAEEISTATTSLDDLRHVHVASLYLHPALVDTLAPVLAAVQASGRTVSLDTNDDPAGAWRGIDDLLPHVDVLLPNAREAVALAGARDDADPVDAARKLADRGPLVVVKLGRDGAIAVNRDRTVVTTGGVPAQVVDTTGAGDTFGAAFLDAWLADIDLATCLARAVHAGARAVGAAGGTAGQPTASELDASTTTERS